MHLVTGAGQGGAQHLARVRVVFYDQHATRDGWRAGRTGGGTIVRGRQDAREAHGECGATPGALARGGDRAAVQLDERLHEREPDAEPAVSAVDRALALDEQVKDARDYVGGDAYAGVSHSEHRRAVLGAHTHRHSASRRSVFERVADQVRDDLLDA